VIKTMLLITACLLFVTCLSSVPRDMVIVEIGTGTWCVYCPGAAMGADDLVENGHHVAIIENHYNDSYANTASTARCTYYGITGYPTAFFDGGNPFVGGSNTVSMYSNYLPRVNARLAVPAHFTISATGYESGGVYNVSVNLNKTETDSNTNLVLHAAVTESNIQQNWQGQTHLNFVTRQMVPSQTGTSVNFGAGTSLTFPLAFTMNAGWALPNCELVIFLQNSTTKEILQGKKYTFAQLFGVSPVTVENLNFPQTYITTTETIPLTLTNPGSVAMSGTITSGNPAFAITPSGRLNYSIPGYGSQNFDISFIPTVPGTVNTNLTITTNLPYFQSIVIPVSGTASYAPPKSPENLTIVRNGLNVIVSWEPVTETVINTPVAPDWYYFYCNNSGDVDGVFTFLGRTRTLSYTHVNAGFNAIPKFYHVIAQKEYLRSGVNPDEYLRPGMTIDEVTAILDRLQTGFTE
jgi:hypothetical protein